MSDYLDYVLSAMRRAAATDCPWTLTPTQAGALVAEVERLREFRNNALHAGNDEVAEEVAEEREAVVAWLRAEAEAAAQTYTVQAGAWANRIDALATSIQRGEHRREEEK